MSATETVIMLVIELECKEEWLDVAIVVIRLPGTLKDSASLTLDIKSLVKNNSKIFYLHLFTRELR